LRHHPRSPLFPYTTLFRSGVELVTEPISHLETGAVVTADGVQREVDAVIYATGFRAGDFMLPMEVIGRGGRQLGEVWAGAAHARSEEHTSELQSLAYLVCR